MTDIVAVVVLTMLGLILFLVCISAVIDHSKAEARCARKGGDFIQTGRYGYVCLKPGSVMK